MHKILVKKDAIVLRTKEREIKGMLAFNAINSILLMLIYAF